MPAFKLAPGNLIKGLIILLTAFSLIACGSSGSEEIEDLINANGNSDTQNGSNANIDNGNGNPDPGSSSTNGDDDAVSEPAISGFDYDLQTGNFWEYRWDYYKNSYAMSSGSTTTDAGRFRLTLGSTTTIDGIEGNISHSLTINSLARNQVLGHSMSSLTPKPATGPAAVFSPALPTIP